MTMDPKDLDSPAAVPSDDAIDPDEDASVDSPIHWRIEAGPDTLSVARPDRIDRWLATAVSSGLGTGTSPNAELPPLSRNRLKSLILDGRISVDGVTISDPSAPVKPGSVFDLSVPPPEAAEPVAQDIPLSVVFEDAHLIVVDKPAGMTVHPAPGSPDRTLVNALLFHCGDSLSGIGGVKRPGIVHRIDKDTSGLLVVAKSDAAHHGLADLFAEHNIERTYRALAWGVLLPSVGHIETDIGRHPSDRKRMAVRPEGRGKHAVTHYKVLEPFGETACLVECQLETGRTHQIRVHLAHLGHPLVGDPVYARGRTGKVASLEDTTRSTLAEFPRQALHAASLGFVHPITGDELFFESPSPSDFENVIKMLRSDTRPPLKPDR
jgi:23S rRNA pseudouridine1911/1915/1917 synthase